jgi:hypothetical protein
MAKQFAVVKGTVVFSSLFKDWKSIVNGKEVYQKFITIADPEVVKAVNIDQAEAVQKLADKAYTMTKGDYAGKQALQVKYQFKDVMTKYRDLSKNAERLFPVGSDGTPLELAAGQVVELVVFFGYNATFKKDYISLNELATVDGPVKPLEFVSLFGAAAEDDTVETDPGEVVPDDVPF